MNNLFLPSSISTRVIEVLVPRWCTLMYHSFDTLSSQFRAHRGCA